MCHGRQERFPGFPKEARSSVRAGILDTRPPSRRFIAWETGRVDQGDVTGGRPSAATATRWSPFISGDDGSAAVPNPQARLRGDRSARMVERTAKGGGEPSSSS